MIVKADGPWQTLEQLVADAKAGSAYFWHSWHRNQRHFAMELFEKETGVDFIHVPLGGEAPLLRESWAAISTPASLAWERLALTWKLEP